MSIHLFLFNYISVAVYGGILSASFSKALDTRKHRTILGICMLETENDVTADWENGVFCDIFRGVWGSIDGALVYMELSYEGEDYKLYSVPVLPNGEEYVSQKGGIL